METNEVFIQGRNHDGGFGLGSGAVYEFGERQYAITNAHVVSNEDQIIGFEHEGAFYMHVTASRLGQAASPSDNYLLGRVTAFIGCADDNVPNGGIEAVLDLFRGYQDSAILELIPPNENEDLYEAYAESISPHDLSPSNDMFPAYNAASVREYLDERNSRFLPRFILGEQDFLIAGFPGGDPTLVEGQYEEMPGIITLSTDSSNRIVGGISGSSIIDRSSGMPIGIVTASLGDGRDKGYGVYLEPVLDQLALIDSARQAGVETYITSDVEQCAMGSDQWHYETFVDGEEVSPRSAGVMVRPDVIDIPIMP